MGLVVVYNAGSASVKVGPDLTGFHRDTEAQLNAMDITFGVVITADMTRFAPELETHLGRIDAELDVRILPDITGFAPLLDTELSRIDAEFDVRVVPDITGFAPRLEGQLGRIDASVDVDVHPDMTGFEAELQAYLDALSPTVTVGVDLDTAAAAARLALLTRDRTININTNGPIGGLGNLGSLGSSAGAAAGGMSKLQLILGAVVTLAPAVIGAIGSIGVGLAGLGTVAGPAIAALGVGLNGVFDAFSAAGKQTAAAGDDAEDAAKKQRDALRGLGSAQKSYQDSVEDEVDAQEDITRARKDAQRQLEDLNLTVKGSALDEKDAVLAIAQAERDLRELGRDGEPVDPLDREAANLRVEQSIQRLAEVQQRNNNLAEDAADANAKGVEGSDQVVQAKERQVDAEGRITESLQDVRDAQDAVTESYESSSTAADAYADAMAKLTPAAQAFVTQMRSLGEAGGSWQVFSDSVQEGLFTGIGDSLYNLANTVLPAITPGMTAIANSLGGVVSSIAGVLSGPAGGQLVTLLESIPTFFTAMQPGIDATVEGFLAFGEAAAPAMQALGQGMGDVLGQIGNAFVAANESGVLTQAISGFGDVLTGLGQFLGPLVTMAVELGAVMGPILGDLFSSLGRTVTNLLPSFTQLADVVGNALLTVFEALEPVLPVVFQAFADILTAVAPLLGPLTELAGVIITGLATNLSALAIALMPVITAIADALMPVIPILTEHFATLTPILAEVATTIGLALADAVVALAPLLPTLLQAFSDLIVAVSPLLPVLADLAVLVIPPVTDAIVTLAPIVVGLIDTFISVVDYVVPYLIPALESLATPISAVGDYFSAMAGTVAEVWDGVVTTIKRAVRAIGEILQKVPDSIGVGPAKVNLSGVSDLGDQMVQWATASPTSVRMVPTTNPTPIGATGPVSTRAAGGPIHGPGSRTSDSIVGVNASGWATALVSDDEHVWTGDEVDAVGGHGAMERMRAQARAGQLGRYAVGGEVQWGGSGIDRSIYDAAVTRFGDDGVTVTSALRSGASGHHGTGTAVDLVGPDMQAIADYFYATFPGMAQLIYGPGPLLYNDRGTTVDPADQAQMQKIYASDLPGHFDHVHLANNEVLGAGASSTPAAKSYGGYDPKVGGQQYQSAYNSSAPGDYSSPYTTGGGTASSALPEKLSAQAIGAKAGTIVANGILSFFGLENSVLSESNSYNRVLNQGIEAYSAQQNDSAASSSASGYTSGTAYAAPVGSSPSFDYSGATPAPESADAGSLGHTYDPAGGAMQWRPTVLAILAGTGRSADLAPRTIEQIDIESSGNPGAVNLTDSNAAAGYPSAGLLQMIIGTYNSHIDPRYPSVRPVLADYPQSDPESNIAAALNYADDEYGGPQNIWPKVNGYAAGSWIRGIGGPRDDANLIAASAGEFMVRADRAAENGPLLEMINGDRAWSTPADLFAGGLSSTASAPAVHDNSLNYGDVYTQDPDDFFERQEREVTRRNMGQLAGRG